MSHNRKRSRKKKRAQPGSPSDPDPPRRKKRRKVMRESSESSTESLAVRRNKAKNNAANASPAKRKRQIMTVDAPFLETLSLLLEVQSFCKRKDIPSSILRTLSLFGCSPRRHLTKLLIESQKRFALYICSDLLATDTLRLTRELRDMELFMQSSVNTRFAIQHGFLDRITALLCSAAFITSPGAPVLRIAVSLLCRTWLHSSDHQAIRNQINDHLANHQSWHRIARTMTYAVSGTTVMCGIDVSISTKCQCILLRVLAALASRICRDGGLYSEILVTMSLLCRATNHIELLRSAMALFCALLTDARPSLSFQSFALGHGSQWHIAIEEMLKPMSLLLMYEDEELLCLVIECYGALLQHLKKPDNACDLVLRGGMNSTDIIADYQRLWQAQDTLFNGAIRRLVDSVSDSLAMDVPTDVVSEIRRFFHAFPGGMDCDVRRRMMSLARDSRWARWRVLSVVGAAAQHADFDSAEWIDHGIVELLEEALCSSSEALLQHASDVLVQIAWDRPDLVSGPLLDALLSVSRDALNEHSARCIMNAMSIIFTYVVVMDNMDAMLDVFFASFSKVMCSAHDLDWNESVLCAPVDLDLFQNWKILSYQGVGRKLLGYINVLGNDENVTRHEKQSFIGLLRNFVSEHAG